MIYASTFSKILSPGVRLGWTAAPAPVLAKMNIGKQASDLCSSSISQYFVGAYFDSGAWQDYVRSLIEIYRRRRDVMLDSLAEHFPREAEWTHPTGRAVHLGDAPRLHRHDRPAGAGATGPGRVRPGRAAYVDGRGGSSMRLNFSGADEEQIREGIRRIGEVVREQVALYGTLTGATAAPGRSPRRRGSSPAARRGATGAPPPGAELAKVLRLPQSAPNRMTTAEAMPVARVAVLKGGRSLERQVSLKIRRAGGGRARAPGPRRRPNRRGRRSRRTAHHRRAGVAFVALHGRDGEDGTVQELLEVMGIPYTGSGVSACIRAADKVLAKHAMRDGGIPTPDFYAFNETAFRELGAAQALPAIEDRLRFPIVVKPAAQGSALGIKFARTPADVPAALVAAFSYDRKVLLERYVRGATWRCRSSATAAPARRCRSWRRCPSRKTSTTSSRATRSDGHGSSARPLSRPLAASRSARTRGVLAPRVLGVRAHRSDARA